MPPKRIGGLAILAAICLCGWGCSSSHPPQSAMVSITDKAPEDMVLIGALDTAYVNPYYRLSAGDEIEISFLFDHTLDSRISIRPDGGINLPILGDLLIAGQSPGDLCKKISQAYAQYYTNPQVSINLTRYAPPRCYVLGDVRYPRGIEIRPGMTVLAAVAEAGGGDQFGNLGSTIILRRIAHNQAVAWKVDLTRFAKGRPLSSDLYLQDYDIIYVPRTAVGKVVTTVNQILSGLAAAPVFYLRGWEAFHTDRVYSRNIPQSDVPVKKPSIGDGGPEAP